MKKKSILIINGPNLNLLGTRQPEIYGKTTFEDYLAKLRHLHSDNVELIYYQSNSEGALIDCIQEYSPGIDGIIINAGAYTHTSVALHDALANVSIPKIEVHISNIHKREAFRQHSYLSPVSNGIIIGMGLKGYELALQYLMTGE